MSTASISAHRGMARVHRRTEMMLRASRRRTILDAAAACAHDAVAGDDERAPCARARASCRPAPRTDRRRAHPAGTSAYCVTSVDAGSCTKNSPCLKRAELRERRRRAGAAMLSRTSGALRHSTPASLEHRLELLAHDVVRAQHRATPRGCSRRAAARVSAAPHRATQRATSQRGCEYFERERVDGIRERRDARARRARDRRGAAPRSPACSRRCRGAASPAPPSARSPRTPARCPSTSS